MVGDRTWAEVLPPSEHQPDQGLTGYTPNVNGHTVEQAQAGLNLRSSQWVISSDAYIDDAQGELQVVIHSMATHLSPSFSNSDLQRLTARHRANTGLVGAGLITDTETLIRSRLGVEVELKNVGLHDGNPSDAEGDEVDLATIKTIESWLVRLGLPASFGLGEALLRTPVPVLGSPPETWRLIAEILKDRQTSPYVIAAGFAAWTDRPLIFLLTGSTGLVIWFARPFGETIRDHFVKSLQERLERDPRLHEPSEQGPTED